MKGLSAIALLSLPCHTLSPQQLRGEKNPLVLSFKIPVISIKNDQLVLPTWKGWYTNRVSNKSIEQVIPCVTRRPPAMDKAHWTLHTLNTHHSLIAKKRTGLKIDSFCRWLSDKSSPVIIVVVGLLISVVPFALLGPSPFLEPLLERAHLLGGWHVWVSLVLLGSGCAMSLMPILPALLTAAEKA